MSKEVKNLIVGLDIGTSKIVSIVAELTPEGRLEILGLGTHQESRGLKKGVVVNIEATVNAISRVIQEVELMADCKVKEVYTGIAGSHIKSFNSNGMVGIKAGGLADGRRPRHRDRARHADPLRPADPAHPDAGIHRRRPGRRARADRHERGTAGSEDAYRHRRRLGGAEHRQVRAPPASRWSTVLQPLASSYAVLTEDEKELGVCLVDIGGGTTDIAVFTQGAIRHTAVIPVAGDQITNDIAHALRTPTPEAEEIKVHYGVALQQLADPEEMFEVPGIGERGPRRLSRQALADVIEPRVTELYELIQSELRRSGYQELLSSGIVLTGGSSVMRGMVELGEEIFHMPVRLGIPKYSGSLAEVVQHPRYATAMGLLLEGMAQKKRGIQAHQTRTFKQVLGNMKSWFEKNF